MNSKQTHKYRDENALWVPLPFSCDVDGDPAVLPEKGLTRPATAIGPFCQKSARSRPVGRNLVGEGPDPGQSAVFEFFMLKGIFVFIFVSLFWIILAFISCWQLTQYELLDPKKD